jgi:hypothetical protein
LLISSQRALRHDDSNLLKSFKCDPQCYDSGAALSCRVLTLRGVLHPVNLYSQGAQTAHARRPMTDQVPSSFLSEHQTTNLGVRSSNLFGCAQCNQRLTSISQFSADLLIPTGAHSWAHMMSVWRRPRAHPASGAFDLSAVAAPPALTSFADLAFSLPRFPRCLKLFSAL